MQACSVETWFTWTKILSSASSILHGESPVGNYVLIYSWHYHLVFYFLYNCIWTLFSLHLRNVIQFVGRRQLPVTCLRTPISRFFLTWFFKLSARYLSHINSTRSTWIRRLEIYSTNGLMAWSRNIFPCVGFGNNYDSCSTYDFSIYFRRFKERESSFEK